MILTRLSLNIEGRKFFDKLAGEKVRVTDFRAVIEFPAPYAIYAFNSPYSTSTAELRGARGTLHGYLQSSAPRLIREKSILRRGNEIRNDFESHYLKNFSVPGAVNFATRRHIEAMRSYELNAPGPRPPARNPHHNRLRRVTGRLADTAQIPRQPGRIKAGEKSSSYVRRADAKRYARRLSRSTTFNIGRNARQR